MGKSTLYQWQCSIGKSTITMERSTMLLMDKSTITMERSTMLLMGKSTLYQWQCSLGKSTITMENHIKSPFLMDKSTISMFTRPGGSFLRTAPSKVWPCLDVAGASGLDRKKTGCSRRRSWEKTRWPGLVMSKKSYWKWDFIVIQWDINGILMGY